MLDIMGVNQHHDAVTGTAKQFVANDYASNLYNSIQRNNLIYSRLIRDIALNNS
jgi:hypothetical protein